jgi:hypothetical protein
MNKKQCAELLDISIDCVEAFIDLGVFPAPNGKYPRRPDWDEVDIIAFKELRKSKVLLRSTKDAV